MDHLFLEGCAVSSAVFCPLPAAKDVSVEELDSMSVDDFLNFYEESFLEVADCAAYLIKKGGSDVVSKWNLKYLSKI